MHYKICMQRCCFEFHKILDFTYFFLAFSPWDIWHTFILEQKVLILNHNFTHLTCVFEKMLREDAMFFVFVLCSGNASS